MIWNFSFVVVKKVNCVMGKTYTKDELRNLVEYNGIAFYDNDIL